jgi:glutamine synthetase
MPKPFAHLTGNGAHFNMSLAHLESGENLFKTDADGRGCGLSQLGYKFIGGLIAHGRGLMACAAPTSIPTSASFGAARWATTRGRRSSTPTEQ